MTGIAIPLRDSCGSRCGFSRRQKWMQTVLEVEKRNPLMSAQYYNLLRQRCRCRSIICMCFDLWHIRKSSTYREHSTLGHITFTIELKFKGKIGPFIAYNKVHIALWKILSFNTIGHKTHSTNNVLNVIDLTQLTKQYKTQFLLHVIKSMHCDKYTVSQKNSQNCFCHNFVKCPSTLIIFGPKMAKTIEFCKIHSFSTLPNLCQCTTVWNADTPNWCITQNYCLQ